MLLEYKYEQLKNTPSDINEHLETLYNLASECKSIVELGVRNAVSDYAICAGMERDAKFIAYDIVESPEARELEQLAKKCSKDYQFMIGDSKEIEIPECDMLFIDTRHIYDLLKEELTKHHNNVKKYIVMHDTTSFGEKGELRSGYQCEKDSYDGLNKAINEFIQEHPEWNQKVVYTNNNGLTVLIKKQPQIVYTAIYGDFETLKKQPRQNIDVRFVCFTDRDDLEIEPGAETQREIIINKDRKELHNRIRAKYFRIHPFEFFDADKVMYIDGSARLLREDSVQFFTEQLQEDDILNFKHPNRDNVYDEAKFCMMLAADNTGPRFTKYIGLPLIEQVEHYRTQGLPDEHVFSATGLLVYKRSEKVIDALDERYKENIKWTYQDQLSFPYIVWKHGLKNKYLDIEGTLWKNDYITFNPHKRPD